MAYVNMADASCVGRKSLHACCEFAGIDALLVGRKLENMKNMCCSAAPALFLIEVPEISVERLGES